MKLGALSRTIIVASCFWMAGGTFYIATNLDDDARAGSEAFYEACMGLVFEGSPTARTPDYCRATRDQFYESRTSLLVGGLWGYASIIAAYYLLGALIVFGLIYGSIRWIVAGRKGY